MTWQPPSSSSTGLREVSRTSGEGTVVELLEGGAVAVGATVSLWCWRARATTLDVGDLETGTTCAFVYESSRARSVP